MSYATDVLTAGLTYLRDYQTDGVPASGEAEPDKIEGRALVAAVSAAVAGLDGAIVDLAAALLAAGAIVVDESADLPAGTEAAVGLVLTGTDAGLWARPAGGAWAATGLTMAGSVAAQVAANMAAIAAEEAARIAAFAALGDLAALDTLPLDKIAPVHHRRILGRGGPTDDPEGTGPVYELTPAEVRSIAEAAAAADLTAETTARAGADTALATALTSETTARTSADAALSTSLATETTARTTADTALSTALNAETAARTTADTTEAGLRASGDAALAASMDVLANGFRMIGPATPSAGNTTVASASLILCNGAVDAAGTLTVLSVYAQAAGNITFAVFRPPAGQSAATGVALTRVHNSTHAVVAGLNELTVSIAVQAGDVYGFSGNGILRYDSTQTGGGLRYWSVVNGTTVTPGSYISDTRWQFAVRFEPTDRIRAVEASLSGQIAGVSAEISAVSDRVNVLELVRIGHQEIGPATLDAGDTTLTSSSLFLCDQGPVADGTITVLRVYAQTSGNVTLLVYRPAAAGPVGVGSVVNRVHSSTHAVVAGLNEITVSIAVLAGDLHALGGNGILRYDSTQTGGGRRYRSITNSASITLGAPNTDLEWQFGVHVEFAAAASGGAGYADTAGYVAVWIVGQSNAAGRGTTPGPIEIAAGRGYKYDPTSSTLVHLADPTGTDATAQANGSPSIGPAICQALLDATGGRVGAIIVNSAIGGTASSTWITGGSSWAAATPMWTAAIADAAAKHLNVIGAVGVVILGETDGANSVSGATHKANMIALRDNMAAATGLGGKFPLILSQIGIDTTNPNSSGYAAIRQAQTELSHIDGFILAHAGARYFSERGLMLDSLHYASAGYDEIGGAIGAAIAAFGIGHRPTGLD